MGRDGKNLAAVTAAAPAVNRGRSRAPNTSSDNQAAILYNAGRVDEVVAAIEAHDLLKRYGTTEALRGIDLTIEKGEFFGLFGPNGAGKTTMLRILTGQLRPTSGDVRVLGVDVVREPLKVKSLVGIVPEVESPPSYLSAYEYLYFVGRVRKLDGLDGRVGTWLEFFDLHGERDSLCKDLSKGTRQKLMLAAAFIHEPQLVFLDEPFINLDPIYQRKLRDHLEDFVASGGTVFMASHLLDIAEKLCDHVAVIRDGRLIAMGTVDQIRGVESDLEAAFLRLVGVRP